MKRISLSVEVVASIPTCSRGWHLSTNLVNTANKPANKPIDFYILK